MGYRQNTVPGVLWIEPERLAVRQPFIFEFAGLRDDHAIIEVYRS